jgi:uncharacterized integral membrane protein
MTEPGAPGPLEPPPGGEAPAPKRNEARSWAIVAVLALAVAYVIAFAVENTTSVPIHWVVGTTHSSLIWVIFVSLVLGAFVGVLAVHLRRRARRRTKSADD